jgi:aldehyde dehydrogenase (NAD+)
MYSDFDKLIIGGGWRPGKSKKVLEDRNPYNGELLTEIVQANAEDLDAAYAAAAKAQPAWAAVLPAERAAIMRSAAQVMELRHDEIVTWLVRESGSTRIKSEIEWESARAVLLGAAALPYLAEGHILPADVAGKESRTYRKPVGVVGVISPWNWPLHLSMRSVAPALAVGNAVVLKPSSDTPVTGGTLVAKIFEEAGVPWDVLSVVAGSAAEIGDAFVKHPTPRVISFTGSTAVGRGIARLGADAPLLKRVELELGGNTPFVVLDDADLERAVQAAVVGRFLHQGEICMSANRFVVDASVHDAFVDRFVERAKRLKYGDPAALDTVIGPIINAQQLRHVTQCIEEGRAGGARQLLGGEPQGQVVPPHVLVDVAPDNPLARKESFGPVAPVIRARDEEDALRIANDTEFGLAGAVFTRDLGRGERFAQRMEVGMAHVNDQPVNDLPNAPFGGEKNSGIGRFNGPWAVTAFTTEQWVTVQHEPRRFPF